MKCIQARFPFAALEHSSTWAHQGECSQTRLVPLPGLERKHKPHNFWKNPSLQWQRSTFSPDATTVNDNIVNVQPHSAQTHTTAAASYRQTSFIAQPFLIYLNSWCNWRSMFALQAIYKWLMNKRGHQEGVKSIWLTEQELKLWPTDNKLILISVWFALFSLVK